MTLTDRISGRQYQLIKVFVASDEKAKFTEAKTGRRYNLYKLYI